MKRVSSPAVYVIYASSFQLNSKTAAICSTRRKRNEQREEFQSPLKSPSLTLVIARNVSSTNRLRKDGNRFRIG